MRVTVAHRLGSPANQLPAEARVAEAAACFAAARRLREDTAALADAVDALDTAADLAELLRLLWRGGRREGRCAWRPSPTSGALVEAGE
jgi:hypothetical protein